MVRLLAAPPNNSLHILPGSLMLALIGPKTCSGVVPPKRLPLYKLVRNPLE